MKQTNTDRVRDLVAQMTLDEKLAQLGSAWLPEITTDGSLVMEKARSRIGHGIGQMTRLAGGSNLTPPEVARAANAVQVYLRDQTRLGIPALIHDECCSGFMARAATAFPQIIGAAATWDPALVEEMAGVIRDQMRATGTHQGLAPVLDVCRDPRWGRIEETFGEDPHLIARLGTAYVRGLQGPDLRQGVVATAKHFAGYGMSEGGLNWAPAHIGPRELRETYLHPFEAAVKVGRLASVMNAYHELDGVPCAASRGLLTGILRDEWGFDGIVVSDYNAVPMLQDYHFIAADKSEAAALALEAGIDVELPQTDCYGAPLRAAIEAGRLDLPVVDEAVRRVLSLKERLGLFDNPFVDEGTVSEVYDTPAQRDLARRVARESMVLLKNEGDVLPLGAGIRTLAVIGPNADDPRNLVGDYSYASVVDLMVGYPPAPDARAKYPEALPRMVTPLAGIQARAGDAVSVRYARGCGVLDPSTDGFAEAVEAATAADVSVLVLGGKSGLTPDATCGEFRDSADLRLPGAQEALAHAVLDTGTPVVLVLLDGRPLAIPALAERAAAVLVAWVPGEEGGAALAEVLFGDASPSGKLPASMLRSAGQVPSFYGHKPSGGRSFPFNDYVNLSVKPLYPFGHGLSYTQFEYANLSITPEQISATGQVEISLDVRNAGTRAGDEVVQVYVHDVLASITRPVKQLVAFARVTVQPGEQRRVAFTVPVAQLGFYDAGLRYEVEPGRMEVFVGASSEDIRLTGAFEITGAGPQEVEKVFFGEG